ncbi:protein nrt1/ ptr family 7.3 [Phtheirospermum japonicum]|uniref:Protein nrt1/ ptr family 7.3 n=1 Tax=Phtheirospermum japonicum TaxID=374723 RepID=A0A830CI32_9LAMI|nr:protein nrt1/ ptr family 7.3 [Phtheirospermum japonicum]
MQERGIDEYVDACTTDGTIDIYGKPAVREKTGGWKAGSLVLVTEGLAALAFTGVEVNMVVFLKSVLRQSNANAANTFSTWMGTLNMCTLFGAFLSDSYLGRYLTCVVFQAVLVIGLLLLSLSTQEFMLEPKGCGTINDICNPPSPPKVASFYVSIFLLALGSGAIEPALATLGADQFDEGDPEENKSKNSFFSYYYVALNIGSLIAETVLVYIENLGKWVLAFWVSTLCGFLALIFLLSGTCRYRHTRPSGNPVSRFCQVIVACVRKLKVDVPLHGEGLYEVQGRDDKECARRLSHTNDFKMTESDEILLSIKGQTPNPWRLCTATQVEEVKCVLRLLPIWFCAIVTSVVFVQVLSLFVEQGSAMNTKISSNFHIAPASMTAFDIISTSTFIISYEKVIVPFYIKLTKKEPRAPSELQRMGIGMVVAIIGMIVAGLVEQCRLKYADEGETSSLSIFWQVPQYVLVGVSEAFIYVAQWEFFASQIPEGLKSIGLGMSMSSSALGSFLCSIILTVVMKITAKDGKPGWISPNLNEGHMDRFFFLSAALIAFDLVVFVACANRFKCIVKQEKRDEENESRVLA